MGMTNEQLLQSITTVIVDRFDMLDGRIERFVVVKHFCNTYG